MVKRFFGFMLSGMMIATSFTALAEEKNKLETKVYDECILVSGYLPYVKSDEAVSILVLNTDIDIENFDEYEKLEDMIVYHGETFVDKNSKYEFLFKTESGGKHYVYVSTDSYSDVMSGEYSYISKSIADNMPTSGKDDLYSYMKSNKALMGLDEEFYTDEVISDIAEILVNSKEDLELNKDTLTEMTEMGFVISGLNRGEIRDIKDYKNMLGIMRESDIKYFPTEYTVEFTELLKERNFKTIKEFNEALREEIIVFTVNNSPTGKIKSVISENKDIFVDVTVSTALAEHLKENAPFSNVEDIKKHISNYKPSGNTSSGGNGGGGSNHNATLPNLTGGKVTQIPEEEQEFLPFDDVADMTWAKDAIVGLYHKGIINGKETGKFYPNDNITRNEFAKIVTVAFDLNLIDDYFPFSDITESHWAYPYVKTAYLAGITNGYRDNYFGGDEFITRQDLCVMVYRAFEACDIEIAKTESKELVDENEIADYAKAAVKELVKCGIISGDENSRFNPKNNATRAEAAKILYMAIDKMK